MNRSIAFLFLFFPRALGVIGATAGNVLAQTVSYDCNSFPEVETWDRNVFCEPERLLENGRLVETLEVDCGGPPGGDWDYYTRSLEALSGETTFYFEWRMQTDGDRSQITGGAPASFVTADLYGVSYHFTIAKDQIRLIRDNFLPLLYVDVQPEIAHTYRLELYGAENYTLLIDGVVVDSGVPEGVYPTPTAVVQWGNRAWHIDNTTQWDYIRYGTIPPDASGDYDSSETVDTIDHYFFQECLSNNGPESDAGPGCRFADFDADTDTDLLDFAEFQNAFHVTP